jgi:hypothetical protein
MRVLIEDGADVNWKTRLSKQTIFAIAADVKQFDAALLLLENGFNESLLSADETSHYLFHVLGSSRPGLIERLTDIVRKAGVTEKEIELMRFVDAASRGDFSHAAARLGERG